MGEEPAEGTPLAPAAGSGPTDSGPDRDAARVRLLTIEARESERRLVAARDEVARLRARARTEHEKVVALRQRRSVRTSDAIGRVFRVLARAVRTGRLGRASGTDRPARSRPDRRVWPEPTDRGLAQAYRSALLAAVHGQAEDAQRLHIALLGDPGALAEAAASLRAQGFVVAVGDDRTAAAPGDVDVVVARDGGLASDPPAPGVISVWWSSAGAPPADHRGWDICLESGPDLAPALIEALDAWLAATRVSIRAATKSTAVERNWGDTYLAWDLATALGRLGLPTRVHYRDAWTDAAVGRSDVVLDLLGLVAPSASVGNRRIVWLISHPEQADPGVLARYDLVYVASDSFADLLGAQTDTPVRPLHQAADPVRFAPSEDGPQRELIYVANWRPGRRMLVDLLPVERDLQVFGRGWTADRLDQRFFAGEHIPNEELGRWYGSSAIVLNDHWAGMRREGFISNRIYEAAATGALVISDDVVGLDDEFDGGVIWYADRDHLRALVERYLDDPPLRRATSERARQAVLHRHTFDHRARVIRDDLAALPPA